MYKQDQTSKQHSPVLHLERGRDREEGGVRWRNRETLTQRQIQSRIASLAGIICFSLNGTKQAHASQHAGELELAKGKKENDTTWHKATEC